jgi:hypothetical protein
LFNLGSSEDEAWGGLCGWRPATACFCAMNTMMAIWNIRTEYVLIYVHDTYEYIRIRIKAVRIMYVLIYVFFQRIRTDTNGHISIRTPEWTEKYVRIRTNTDVIRTQYVRIRTLIRTNTYAIRTEYVRIRLCTYSFQGRTYHVRINLCIFPENTNGYERSYFNTYAWVDGKIRTNTYEYGRDTYAIRTDTYIDTYEYVRNTYGIRTNTVVYVFISRPYVSCTYWVCINSKNTYEYERTVFNTNSEIRTIRTLNTYNNTYEYVRYVHNRIRTYFAWKYVRIRTCETTDESERERQRETKKETERDRKRERERESGREAEREWADE